MAFEYVTNVFVDGASDVYPGGAADYELQVRRILDNIRGTATGRTVLDFFALRHHRANIVPPDDNQSRRVAGAGAVDPTAAFRRGFELRSGRDGSEDPDHRRGTGSGSDSRIRFHPIHWSDAATTFDYPEEVLLHELFHAMRQVFGALRNTPMGGDFETVEELYSIFVQNMYATERGLPLRATHKRRSSNVSPDHSMRNNPLFHAPMRDLFAMMPTIGNALARVRTAYNPFRDWQEFSREAARQHAH